MNIQRRTALALILIGVGIIYGAETVYDTEQQALAEVSEDDIGERVKVPATIRSVKRTQDVAFITAQERPGFEIVSFTPMKDVREGDTVTITGKVDMYEGDLEIIVDSVTEQEN